MKNRLIINIAAISVSAICFSQNLKMELKVEACIGPSSQNKVTYLIENPTDSDIWINPRYLTFYFGVYSKDGNIVTRKTTRHLDGMESNFLKIEKNSKREIKWSTSYFDNLMLEQNKEYYIESGYEPPHLRRKQKRELKVSNIVLSESQFSGKSNLFQICKI